MIILFFFYIFFFKIINTKNYNIKLEANLNKNHNNEKEKQNIIHFIKCGHGDSILVEGKGHFGLIDSANPVTKNSLFDNANSVLIVLNYLKELKVKKLDFIIGTHAHSDHIGGIKEICDEYIDNTTIYYYKKLNLTFNLDKYINYRNYLNAIDSIKRKNATLVDVTNKKIIFHLGEIMLILLNTYNYNNYNHIILDENQNSIVTLIKYNNINIVLPGDMTNEYKIISHFGDINILKFPHHGVGDIRLQNLIKLKPAHIIISSDHIFQKTFKLMEYMKNKYKSKIYLLKDIKQTAIKLYLKSNNVQFYDFNNNDIDGHFDFFKNSEKRKKKLIYKKAKWDYQLGIASSNCPAPKLSTNIHSLA